MTGSHAPTVHDARRWSRDDDADRTASDDRAPVATGGGTESATPAEPAPGSPLPLIRIGTMIRSVLEEMRRAPLDEAARDRVAELHRRAVDQLAGHLVPDLRAELRSLDLPLPTDRPPGDVELRLAEAQLVGWLEGVFQGAQIAVMSQQMAARAQLEHLHGGPGETRTSSSGQYL